MQTRCLHAPLHIELWLTPAGDELRIITTDRSDRADHLSAERGAPDLWTAKETPKSICIHVCQMGLIIEI